MRVASEAPAPDVPAAQSHQDACLARSCPPARQIGNDGDDYDYNNEDSGASDNDDDGVDDDNDGDNDADDDDGNNDD